MSIFEYLKDSIPTDHCKQTRLAQLIREKAADGYYAPNVLDFGCGDGRSIALFQDLMPSANWTGVDIEDSPEVNSRRFEDPRFVTYNGTELPFSDEDFDLVYSHQVLEHVRHPDMVLSEIRRVLSPTGLFIGQTSQFEPYHSYSIWNFTVYGFKRLIEDAGMRLKEIRPAIDGFTLMERVYQGRPKSFDKYAHEESPRNIEIEKAANEQAKSAHIINYRKLMFAGQFTFVCSKQ